MIVKTIVKFTKKDADEVSRFRNFLMEMDDVEFCALCEHFPKASALFDTVDEFFFFVDNNMAEEDE